MKPWEQTVEIDEMHQYECMTAEGPLIVASQIRSLAPTLEEARVCGAVVFRMYLDNAGIPWRRLSEDGRDQDPREDDQSDPR